MIDGRQETKPQLVTRRKRHSRSGFSKRTKSAMVGGVAGIVVITVTFIISSITGNATIRDMGVVGGVVAGITPIATANMTEIHRKNSIDKNLSIFLLSLRSSVVSSHSILQAISEAADRKMGSLTPELKNLRANLSWGMPVEDALNNFTERVGTRMARRVMVLLHLAMESGGDVAETVETIQKHVSELQNVENERKSTMRPYVFTIYISFAVFLAIVAILVFQFFAEVEKIQISLAASENGAKAAGLFGGLANVNIGELNKLMLHMSIVESIFGGVAAGKIGEGSFIAGIKHVVILIVISIIVFAMIGAV